MNKKIRILLVDDDEDDYILTEDLLSQIPWFDFELCWAINYDDALSKIQNEHFDIFLLDFLLGQHTGLEILDVINEDLPAILLTGKGDPDIDRVAVEKGAYDYLEKINLNADSLERSIRYALKHAETMRALRESEKKYRTVFEHSKEIIFITNQDLNIISISKAAEELSGYTREEIYRMSSRELLTDPEDLGRMQGDFLIYNSLKDYKLNVKTKSGETRSGILSCVIESNQNGAFFLHGIFSDQTDRIRANKAAIQTEKMEATARLMRILAHEVRNPLTNINLSAESLNEDYQDEYLQSMLQIIRRNSLRIDELITKVLNTARQEEIKLEPAALNAVIEDSLHAIEDRAALCEIEIKTAFNSQRKVMLNAEKLSLALNNILINAVEALEKSKKKQIFLRTFDTEKQTCISVKDTGCGIKKSELSHIFEPFFTAKSNGIGLGLAATLGIIESHNALIEVNSQPEMGTEFLISFPIILLG